MKCPLYGTPRRGSKPTKGGVARRNDSSVRERHCLPPDNPVCGEAALTAAPLLLSAFPTLTAPMLCRSNDERSLRDLRFRPALAASPHPRIVESRSHIRPGNEASLARSAIETASASNKRRLAYLLTRNHWFNRFEFATPKKGPVALTNHPATKSRDRWPGHSPGKVHSSQDWKERRACSRPMLVARL
jgi:hypothetical protein